MHTQDSTPAGKRALLPALMVLVAASICSQSTAAWGHLHPPVFAPAENPDSLNVERVGEVVLLSLPEAGDLPYGTDLYLAGGHALMGDFRGIVHIVDISDPAAMRKVGEVRTPGSAVDIKVAGDLAAIGVQSFTGEFGLLLLDISDPASPVELSRLEEKGWGGVHNLFIQGERVYLAHSYTPGLTIVDISDPAEPQVSGVWRKEGGFSNIVHDVFVRGRLAVLSDIQSGLVLLDLADPDAPELLAELPFAEGLHSAWAEGDYLYCNQEFGGWERRLHVVDISDPRQPRLVHSFGIGPPPQGDILGPHNPWVRDGLLYWAYYDAGLRVFDLTDPARPVEVAYHTYPGSAWSAQPHDDGLVYVADGTVGIQAFRLDREGIADRAALRSDTSVDDTREEARPAAFSLGQNFPNPFNQSTSIRVDLETGSHVELSVFNLAGQRVATLAQGPHLPGTHTFTWDGRDDLGNELASGAYFYRLRADGRERTRKLVLLR